MSNRNRIGSSEKDLSVINKGLREQQALQQTVAKQAQLINQLNQQQNSNRDVRDIVGLNNLLFTWTGGTLTLSWAAGYIQDRAGTTYRVPAGSRAALTASTFYWICWNPYHQSMGISTNLNTLTRDANRNIKPLNLVICQLFTGTGAQTGNAGGGGSTTPGVDRCGVQYKLF